VKNKKIEQQIRYLENKRKFEKFLRENRTLNEYYDDGIGPSSGLFAAFGKAFGDIFKSLKLTAMDISNEFRWLGQQFLYRNNPEKLEKARSDYKRKHDKLLKEWEPIVKDSMNAIKNADPFLTIALAPNVFLATKGIQAGVSAGKNAAEIIAAEDWQSIRAKMNKFQTGTAENPQAGAELGMGAVYDEMRKQGNLLMKLTDLFSGRGATNKNESRLIEQAENRITDPKEWLDTFFELTGIDQEFDAAASGMLADKIVLMQEMIPTIEASIAVIKLVSTDNLDQFSKIAQEIARDSALSSEAISGMKEVMSDVQAQAQKLAASEDFRNQLADAENRPVDQLSDEEVKNAASAMVFKQAKVKFDEQYISDLKKFEDIIEGSRSDLETDNQTLSLVKNRKDLPESSEFLKVYDRYDKLYKEFKNLKQR
jgi:ribosomal protein S8